MSRIRSLDGRKLTTSSGVDFDDPDYGFKEEDKDPEKVPFTILALGIY